MQKMIEIKDVTLKIRGIYATALTAFFTDHGAHICLPSEVIGRRFDDNKNIHLRRPANAEMIDRPDGQGILLSGKPQCTQPVIDLMKTYFLDIIRRERVINQTRFIDMEFPYETKSSMDELRHRIFPTLIRHHRMKIVDSAYVDRLEQGELLFHPEKRDAISRKLENRLIWGNYHMGKEMAIDHAKLDDRVIALSEGEIVEIRPGERKLVLKRKKFKGRTFYDGLKIPKEEGDYAVTKVMEGEWFYSHHYFRRDGQWIGSYHNINTPIEFYPDRIRYVDLDIDVIQWPEGRIEIIDEERLNAHWSAGRISEALKNMAQKTADGVKAHIESGPVSSSGSPYPS